MSKRLAALLLAALLLAGCGARDTAPAAATVFCMDTVMNLTAYGKNAPDALRDVEAELERLDALLARGTEGSAVYTLNHEGSVIDGEVADLLRASGTISEACDEAFDPTVAALLDLWGFGSGAGEHRVPSHAEIAEVLSHVGAKHAHIDGEQVLLDLPTQLDLGGIAKGWAGARAREKLSENGVTSAVLDLGGDVALLGSKPDGASWRVAIRDPAEGGSYLGVLETPGDQFIMTSGVYERYFEENGVRYHHILDPKTGYPASSDLVSATVVCEDGVWADALATACCVLGAEESLALRQHLADTMAFDLLLVTDGGEVRYTCEGFEPETGSGYTYEKVS